VAKTRILLGAAAIPLDTLAKIAPIADKPFASQAALEDWMKERGIDPDSLKKVMARIPTTERACTDTLFCLDRESGATKWKQDLTGNWMWYAASPTPAVSAGKVYFLSSSAVACCLNVADGSIAWQTKPLAGANSHNRSS
jgi:outer membrane protein assembly factor BamB